MNQLTTEEKAGELEPSKLGTKEHWDNTYEDELQNYENHGIVGDSWFGENIETKLVNYVVNKVPPDYVVADLGCGNGSVLVKLAKAGFFHLTGLDYSATAIEMAKKVVEGMELQVDVCLKVHDMLNEEQLKGLENMFKLCLDKGTYDAISLMPTDDGGEIPRLQYLKNIHRILDKNGLFILTSCNWTQSELVKHAESASFVFHDTIETQKFSFGGMEGNSVAMVVFRAVK